MAGLQVAVELDDKALVAGMARMVALARNPEPILRVIGDGLVASTERRIREENSPDGSPFAPLNPAYAATKTNVGILRKTNRLMGSFTREVRGDTIVVGTNVPYAGVHQFGATIVPKAAKALRFFIGPHLVQAQKVTIPARPYLGVSAEDREMAIEAVGILAAKALRGS